MAAPQRADWDHIDRVRLANDLLTRPAHSAYVSRTWDGYIDRRVTNRSSWDPSFANAVINGIEGTVGSVFREVDGALAAVQDGVAWVDRASDSAISTNPALRYVKDVGVSLIHGAVSLPRLATNREMGLGMIGAIENPRQTVAAMRQAFHDASWYDISVGGGAMLAGVGLAGMATRAGSVGRMAGRQALDIGDWADVGVPRVSQQLGSPPAGVVYLRTDGSGNLAPYGGQASSEARFLERQREHSRDFPDSDFDFVIVSRAEPGVQLDIAEHNFIQRLTGGVAARYSPLVSNRVDPMGFERRVQYGLPHPRKEP
jgi:hypothetical protein